MELKRTDAEPYSTPWLSELDTLKQMGASEQMIAAYLSNNPQATLSYKDGVYTITLFRKATVIYNLDGYLMLAVPESSATYYREKVDGPAYNGMLYMFYKAAPESDYLWLSKEEYDTLLPLWDKVQSLDEYSEGLDSECDYCHGPVGRCGGSCKDRDY
jgi:hypothetical protein